MQNPITHFYSVPVGIAGRLIGLVFAVALADAASTRAYVINNHRTGPFWWNRIDGPDFWLLPVSGVNHLLISDLNYIFIPVSILLFSLLFFTERPAIPLIAYVFSLVSFAGYLRYSIHMEPWILVSILGWAFTASALFFEIRKRIRNGK